MKPNEYQELAARTLVNKPPETTDQEGMLIWNAMGLAGEAGEVAEMFKKGIFHQHGVERADLVKELGDVLWYVAGLCTSYGDLTLEEIMQTNIDKLRLRYPNGFDVQDSVARVDVQE